jgi:hypothetical protein
MAMKNLFRTVSISGAFLLSATLSAAPRPVSAAHGFGARTAHVRPTHFRTGHVRPTHFRPSGFRHHWRGSWGWRWGWGWGGWGWGPGWYGPPYGYGYAPYGYGYGAYAPGDWGVVDTDVSPEEARVYLDGRYIGIADDFDGYPDYLYLKPGHYRLEFRLDGYETRSIDLQARVGSKLDINESLKKIPGAKQHGSYDTPVPEGGVHRFWGKEKDVTTAIDVDTEMDGYGDWRDRDRKSDRLPPEDSTETAPAPEPPSPPLAPKPPRAPVAPSAAVAKSRIVFRIEPGDAAVYVDDRFAGTGEELSTLSRGLQVSAGPHKVVVSRPGFATQGTQVDLGAGRSETVEITLERP